MNIIDQQTALETIANPFTQRERVLAEAYRELHKATQSDALRGILDSFFEYPKNPLADEAVEDLRALSEVLPDIFKAAVELAEAFHDENGRLAGPGDGAAGLCEALAVLAEQLNAQDCSRLSQAADCLEGLDAVETAFYEAGDIDSLLD